MSDQHKPLTTAEIERLWALARNDFHAPQEIRDAHRLTEFTEAMPRLLSMLTPPMDAAVRESVERVAALKVEYPRPPLPGYEPIVCMDASDRDILLRAVQAPHLTLEQEESLKHVDEVLRRNGLKNARAFLHSAFMDLFGKGDK